MALLDVTNFQTLSLLYAMVVIGVIVVIVTAIRRIQVGHSSSVKELFKQTRFLELTTVLVIIISGTYLAVSHALTEGVVALLSGIAGYVLGGLSDSKLNEEKPKQPAPSAEKQPNSSQ